jgi:hypothetical protein
MLSVAEDSLHANPRDSDEPLVASKARQVSGSNASEPRAERLIEAGSN